MEQNQVTGGIRGVLQGTVSYFRNIGRGILEIFRNPRRDGSRYQIYAFGLGVLLAQAFFFCFKTAWIFFMDPDNLKLMDKEKDYIHDSVYFCIMFASCNYLVDFLLNRGDRQEQERLQGQAQVSGHECPPQDLNQFFQQLQGPKRFIVFGSDKALVKLMHELSEQKFITLEEDPEKSMEDMKKALDGLDKKLASFMPTLQFFLLEPKSLECNALKKVDQQLLLPDMDLEKGDTKALEEKGLQSGLLEQEKFEQPGYKCIVNLKEGIVKILEDTGERHEIWVASQQVNGQDLVLQKHQVQELLDPRGFSFREPSQQELVI